MKTLVEIFSEIGHFGNDIGCNDKGGQHSYLEKYDELFKPFRIGGSVLEVGLALGDSLRLWCRYFYESRIFGVDISIVFNKADIDPVTNSLQVIEADATKKEFLSKIEGQTFYIIIDDGSHMEADQIATFELLKSKMNPGGIYIIEDILALDQNRGRFTALHENCEIIDLRKVKGRFDDVLIVYRF